MYAHFYSVQSVLEDPGLLRQLTLRLIFPGTPKTREFVGIIMPSFMTVPWSLLFSESVLPLG